MKTWLVAMAATLLLLTLLWAQNAGAPPQALDPKSSLVLLRGQQISEAVATVTSTAISPLLGVCVLGAWEYFRTEKTKRQSLPGYASPWFWIPVAVLLVGILCKDTLGGVAPLLKKPLDAIEVLMLNKASLFLVGFPVVFHEAAKLMGVDSLGKFFLAFEPVAYAQSAPSLLERAGNASMGALLVVGGSIILIVVWLVGHAIDVLVLLSPFPVFDLLLKAARTSLFTAVAGITLLDPRLGALLSAFVILICVLLFGWAFRLMVFGAAFSWDLLRTLLLSSFVTPRPAEPIPCFTARRIQGIPKRSFAHIRRGPTGALELCGRPWLLGFSKTVTLAPDKGYEIGIGLFHPTLLETAERSSSPRTVLRFFPRHRKSEEALAQILGVKGVRDVRFGGGLRAFWRWITDDSTEAPQRVEQTAG
ncbi:MAG: hypothetical protein NZV14_11195 [Bryobacteraceae bacterium]|nr:hypothetical protein [Bryobacteraceae bacterium]MDW8378718.1 hypothetical protein [Bryobacterales bacterium]